MSARSNWTDFNILKVLCVHVPWKDYHFESKHWTETHGLQQLENRKPQTPIGCCINTAVLEVQKCIVLVRSKWIPTYSTVRTGSFLSFFWENSRSSPRFRCQANSEWVKTDAFCLCRDARRRDRVSKLLRPVQLKTGASLGFSCRWQNSWFQLQTITRPQPGLTESLRQFFNSMQFSFIYTGASTCFIL